VSQRLRYAQLASLPMAVRRPAYDRTAQRTGIVHFGIGAFHRAHQAVYTDAAMAAGDQHWAITGVSLRSAEVRNAIQPQDGLYSLTERERLGEHTRVIGSVRDVLVAPEHPEVVIAALASPHVHLVTFTVTEKGYLRNAATGSLLLESPDLTHDLAGTNTPRTIYGFLEQAFIRRRAAGLPGMTLLSCDNLAENGRQLGLLLNEYLERRDAKLAAWARNETSCPSTMVDRIVPATTAEDIERAAATLGLNDQGAVVTEPFKQWVIEDRFIGPRPQWEEGGAQFTSDVRPFETAKLRMLNGAHSALAYVGIGLGFEFVHQAINDPELQAMIRHLMLAEAAASLTPLTGQSLGHYANALLQRFDNPALAHRLIQIAMDGTQKIPQRWLATIASLQRSGKRPAALLFSLAAWIAFVCTPERIVDDPLAAQLTTLREQTRGDAVAAVAAVVGEGGLLSGVWHADSAALEIVAAHLEAIRSHGMRHALQRCMQMIRI
jgi:fructuronate reductase